jgi:hypothetical protein
MNKNTLTKVVVGASFFACLVVFFTQKDRLIVFVDDLRLYNSAAVTATVPSPFTYKFSIDGTLNETGSLNESSSPYWWLNSGGQMPLKGGVGMTMQGDALSNNKWRIAYSKANPLDTDGGLHPQNLFRLFSRSLWKDVRQETTFKVLKDNLSLSPNRNASNALLLMMRYQDSDNLYYAGVRVDGSAVIKKKLSGKYSTLKITPNIFEGKYNIETKESLIPKDVSLGLRSEIKNTPDGKVAIKLFLDVGGSGNWKLVAEAVDDGKTYGKIIDTESSVGIRTDFMDVSFDNYKIEKI